MKSLKSLCFGFVFIFSSFVYAQNLTAKTVEYGAGSKKFAGYLVSPADVKPSTPAVLIVHNWMGLTEETKKQAERFARLGYIVFAADIYGKGVSPKDTNEAAELSGKFKAERKLFRKHITFAFNELKKQKNVNMKKIAVAGYCFGGTAALELARAGADVVGAISFHGGLDSPHPDDGKKIKSKILALHGAIDPFVSEQDLKAFETEMNTNKVDYQLIKYGNSVHSFTEVAAGNDNSKGAAYNAEADKRSFIAAESFLQEIFKNN